MLINLPCNSDIGTGTVLRARGRSGTNRRAEYGYCSMHELATIPYVHITSIISSDNSDKDINFDSENFIPKPVFDIPSNGGLAL
jgi:hypothetical protein